MNAQTLTEALTPPHRIPLSQLPRSLAYAGGLYVRYLWRWLLATILMAIAMEIFMLVPYVGLAFKIAASALLGAQMMAMFEAADSGHKPAPWRVLSGFVKPISMIATLVAAVWLPLSIALLWTFFQDGGQTVATVLSRPGEMSSEAQLHFKSVLFLAVMPVSFVAAAVVVGRLRGMAAFSRAILAAVRNPLPVLLLSGSTIVLENMIHGIFHAIPGALGITIGTILTLLLVTAMSAWSYVLAAWIFSGKGFSQDA